MTAVHIFQAYTFRKSFCWVIVMTAPWETVGFSLRVPSTQQPDSTIFYIPQQILILLAPIWLNAFVYMVFGRMVWYFLPEQKVAGVKAGRLTLFFVLLDITQVSLHPLESAVDADHRLPVHSWSKRLAEVCLIAMTALLFSLAFTYTWVELVSNRRFSSDLSSLSSGSIEESDTSRTCAPRNGGCCYTRSTLALFSSLYEARKYIYNLY